MTRLSRRRFLGAVGAGGLGVGSAKAIDNTVLGYGVGGGTNLREQDLDPLLDENRSVTGEMMTDEARYRITDEALWVDRTGNDEEWREHPFEGSADGLPAKTRNLFEDCRDLVRTTDYEYHTVEDFFDRLAETTPRPLATQALRGRVEAPITPAVVERFSGVSPEDGAGLIDGLKSGFREHGYYDIPRYVAGSVEDNVIMGVADLRAPFEGPTDLDTLIEEGRTGLFCYELSYRAIEALHSVSALTQRPPLVGFWVHDHRHKHVYNGLASVVRERGRLRVPVTFIDYTHSTLYDDLRVTRVVGEGLDAYGRRHRADEIHWDV